METRVKKRLNIQYTDPDSLMGELMDYLGCEPILEAIPNNPYGRRFRCPGGELVNYFTPNGSVTVQGTGDPEGLEEELRKRMHRDLHRDPPRHLVHPVLEPAGVENTVLIVCAALTELSETIAEELSKLGLAPVVWADRDGVSITDRTTEVELLKGKLQFALFLVTPAEWDQKKVITPFAMLSGALGCQQVAVLLTGSRKPAMDTIPRHVRSFLVGKDCSAGIDKAVDYMVSRLGPRLQRIIYRSPGSGYRRFPCTLERESRIDVQTEPSKKNPPLRAKSPRRVKTSERAVSPIMPG
jgi:hypothetical protein